MNYNICRQCSVWFGNPSTTLENSSGIGRPKEEEVRGERTKSGAEIMTSQDGCRCEL